MTETPPSPAAGPPRKPRVEARYLPALTFALVMLLAAWAIMNAVSEHLIGDRKAGSLMREAFRTIRQAYVEDVDWSRLVRGAIHGMVANLWFDRVAGTQFYNVQDPDFPLVGSAGVDASAEIDPTQRAATTDGRSPRAILSSTISDEIALHFGPDSRIFGVSVFIWRKTVR